MSIFLTMAVLDRRKTVLPFPPAAKSSKRRAEDTKTAPDHPAGFQIDPSFFEFDITLYFGAEKVAHKFPARNGDRSDRYTASDSIAYGCSGHIHPKLKRLDDRENPDPESGKEGFGDRDAAPTQQTADWTGAAYIPALSARFGKLEEDGINSRVLRKSQCAAEISG